MRRNIKLLCVISMLMAVCMSAYAAIDTVVVKGNGEDQTFAILDIKDITFSDAAMTVNTLGGQSIAFAGNWQIVLSESESNPNTPDPGDPDEPDGIALVEASGIQGPAEVYTLDGRLVLKVESLSKVAPAQLGNGVYIVKCNGISLKIRK